MAPGAIGVVNVQQENQQINFLAGNFVANDRIDEGVEIVSKLRHGSPPETLDSGVPGTRSRLSSVKVICVARCPKGGHFATGSDDGMSPPPPYAWTNLLFRSLSNMEGYSRS